MTPKFSHNERGTISILLVLSMVTLVLPFVINFTFDTEISKLKVYNIQDRSNARLTAESGLQFAMARLRLYKEGYNFLQKNENMSGQIKPEILDTIWNTPFVYPIPVTDSMNQIQKDAIVDFLDQTVLEGQMQLSINNISNRINLNLLRFSTLQDQIKASQKGKSKNSSESDPPEESEQGDEEYNAESQLVKILSSTLERKNLEDDYFNSLYSDLDISVLINELKYFMSDPNSVEDPAGGDLNFQGPELHPKRAPISSYSEVYSLPTWPDDISNLILGEFTVHGAIMIDLNKITDKLLRILIPEISDEDITEFFEYKNDPEDPKHFNSLDDFKNYIVEIGNILTKEDFDEIFAKYKAQGLQFGPTPTLFKVVSTATVGRSTYTLTAYVVIPKQPEPRKPKEESEGEEVAKPNPNSTEESGNESNGQSNENGNSENGNSENGKEEQKTLLLEPRIVEITVS